MSAPVEPELLCPHCGYNLRGLPEDRCPECGRPFDRARLLELADPKPRAPADEAGRPLGPWRVAVLAAFAPGRLAASMPAQPDPALGIGCTLIYDFVILVGLACGPLCLCMAIVPFARGGPNTQELSTLLTLLTTIGFGAVCGGWMCETVIAALLALFVPPVGVRKRYRFWRAMTHYTGAFLILSSFCVPLLGCVPSISDGPRAPEVLGYVCCFGVWLLIFGWWALALGHMIRARAVRDWRAWLGCAIVPLVGAASAVGTAWLVWLALRRLLG